MLIRQCKWALNLWTWLLFSSSDVRRPIIASIIYVKDSFSCGEEQSVVCFLPMYFEKEKENKTIYIRILLFHATQVIQGLVFAYPAYSERSRASEVGESKKRERRREGEGYRARERLQAKPTILKIPIAQERGFWLERRGYVDWQMYQIHEKDLNEIIFERDSRKGGKEKLFESC